MSYDEHLISMAGGDGEPVDLLASIEARANAATEGPWEQGHNWDASQWIKGGSGGRKFRPSSDTSYGWVPTTADAEFIAHARTDVPALLALVRDQQAKLDRVLELAHWAGKRGWQIAPATLRNTINEASA